MRYYLKNLSVILLPHFYFHTLLSLHVLSIMLINQAVYLILANVLSFSVNLIMNYSYCYRGHRVPDGYRYLDLTLRILNCSRGH